MSSDANRCPAEYAVTVDGAACVARCELRVGHPGALIGWLHVGALAGTESRLAWTGDGRVVLWDVPPGEEAPRALPPAHDTSAPPDASPRPGEPPVAPARRLG